MGSAVYMQGPPLSGMLRLADLRPQLDEQIVGVAVAPVLPGLERADDRVKGRAVVLGGVLVSRLVAAADVAAGKAQPQVDPAVAAAQALFAALRARGVAVPRCRAGAAELGGLVHGG